MKSNLLDIKVQDFINQSLLQPIEKIALLKNPFSEIDYKIILQQIQSKQKAQKKLPTWFTTEHILYPEKLSIEQTSSEITANYKSQIVFGKNIIDLTGGYGVDTYYFSKKIENVYHCEINAELSEIVAHNFEVLGIKNVRFYNQDGSEVLNSLNQKFDWIYIDPSRRNNDKGKVFMLKDCLPNVPNLLEFYFKYSNAILIKTAPILDISAGLSELKFVKKIHIVAVENEVKELLWEIEKNYTNPIEVKTINFSKKSNQIFDFILNEKHELQYDLPEVFLYEPNAAIMKSGGFEAVANSFKIKKLNKNSHLYTSIELIEEFPGRVFKIENKIFYDKKQINSTIYNTKANITIRNFNDTTENLRKKHKITDGGELYYFFTTNNSDEKIVLICTKI